MAGIIVAIILKNLCKNRRPRASMIVPRRQRMQTIQVFPQQINNINYDINGSDSDSDSSDDYSLSIEHDKEETKEEETKDIHVRFAENV
jgi:hypothetical protein